MPKIEYVPRRFSLESTKIIEDANKIIKEYQQQGFDLTLRQLFYQFVSRDLIPNSMKSYKNLGSIINDARLAGEIDWDAIVDRTRNLESNSHWDGPGEIIASCAKQFQIDKWEGQKIRPEVWIEKDALVGVVERICRKLDVSYFSCRGYTSQSEMWVASQRLMDFRENGQIPIIIHLGDHDPSGKDMTRDILDRLCLFGGFDYDSLVHRVALNMDQIRKYKPPPNPAKVTDSRATKYIQEFGDKSWELDALDPIVMEKVISTAVLSVRDDAKWNAKLKLEEKHRKALEKVAKGFKQ